MVSDLFQLEALISTADLTQRDAVHRLVDAEFLPHARDWYRDGVFPVHLIPKLGDLGVLGANLNGYGCPGKSHLVYGLMMQELERGDSGLRSFASVQTGLAMYPILQFGTEEQKQTWLPRLAKGDAIGCFSLTEPDFGSNPAGLIAQAVKDGDCYVINGHKRWCTSAPIADVCIFFAKLDGRIQGFLVEQGTPGFNVREIRNKYSLRISVSSEIFFENCRIPAANILPGAKGLKSALLCLDQARYSIAWGAIGAALACFEETLDYCQQRIQFGRPIAGFQLVQEKLADLWSEIIKAQLLALRLAQLMEHSEADPAAISLAKRNNVRMARNTSLQCRDLLGAVGILDDYCTMRHLCNIESVYTYEGTDHIHTLILGEKLTRLAAFK